MAEPAVDLPPPQRLALTYASARGREPTHALLSLDAKLAAFLRARREPIAAQLRLAWWRDMLARPVAEWPRGEPVLDSLRAIGWTVLPYGRSAELPGNIASVNGILRQGNRWVAYSDPRSGARAAAK